MQTPKDQWLTTDGLVYSVDWIDPSRADQGHYTVIYSYEAAGERYTGTFYDYGRADESYLHRDDKIQIRFDPTHPEHSEYPDARAATTALPAPIMTIMRILVVVFVVALLLTALFGGFK